ncbi:MAG TPA: hypothetical protein VIW24_01400 [Aldersonia sp.]
MPHRALANPRNRTAAVGIAAVGVAVAAAVAVFVVAFAWPAVNLAPRDLPIGVVGPDPFVAAVEQKLDHAHPGGFTLARYADAAAATEAIRDRDVYGAVVAGDPPTVLDAPAASPAVAQLLDGMAATLAGTPQTHATPVVALAPDDPRGTGFAAGALPIVIGALLGGVASALAFASARQRLAAAATAAVLAGLTAATVLHTWLGVLPGSFLAVAGVLALGLFAGSAFMVGAYSLLGKPGLGLGVLLIMVLGNPLSGATSAPELLPTGWGALGQWLPPGAMTTLLRSVAYFDGAGALQPTLVLTGWIALGLLLAALAGRPTRAAATRVDALVTT